MVYNQLVREVPGDIQSFLSVVKESIDMLNLTLAEYLSGVGSFLPDQTMRLKTVICHVHCEWYININIRIDFEMILPMMTEEQAAAFLKKTIEDVCAIDKAIDRFDVKFL